MSDIVDTGRGRLTQLSSLERLALARELATSKSVTAGVSSFYQQFPEAHEYPYNTILAYFKSKQYLETDRNAALANTRESLEGQYLVPSADRIEELRKLFWKVLERLEKETDIGNEIKLIAEARQIVKHIKEESEPFSSNIGIVLSPLEAFFESRQSSTIKDISPERQEVNVGVQDIPVRTD